MQHLSYSRPSRFHLPRFLYQPEPEPTVNHNLFGCLLDPHVSRRSAVQGSCQGRMVLRADRKSDRQFPARLDSWPQTPSRRLTSRSYGRQSGHGTGRLNPRAQCRSGRSRRSEYAACRRGIARSFELKRARGGTEPVPVRHQPHDTSSHSPRPTAGWLPIPPFAAATAAIMDNDRPSASESPSFRAREHIYTSSKLGDVLCLPPSLEV